MPNATTDCYYNLFLGQLNSQTQGNLKENRALMRRKCGYQSLYYLFPLSKSKLQSLKPHCFEHLESWEKQEVSEFDGTIIPSLFDVQREVGRCKIANHTKSTFT